MYTLRSIVFFIVFSILGFIGYAQDSEFILGKLIDSITREPVVFATVRIKDKALGVISNADGSFKIPKRFKISGELLEISSMGYDTKTVSLSNFKYDSIELIKMKSSLFELDEVVVREKRARKQELTASQIIERSIEKLSENLPENPYSYIGYYRDYQFNDNIYSNLNESLFEVYDQGFRSSDYKASKFIILESINNTDFPIDTIGRRPYDYKGRTKTIPNAFLDSYGGNEYTILRIHNPIRNYKINSFSFINRFEIDFTRNHIFNKEDDVIVDGNFLHHISFKAVDSYALDVKGHIYVTKDNFAIQGLEYAVYDKVMNERSTNKDRLLFKTKVEYVEESGKMYLSYHSMENIFTVAHQPKLQLEQVTLKLNRNSFVLKFNNALEDKSALKKSNYNLTFKGKKLRLKGLVLIEDVVELFPDLNNKNTLAMLQKIKITGEGIKINNKNLKFNLRNIKDINGNLINENWYENRKQFREFFVQKLKLEKLSLPNDNLFMDKGKPIFNEFQPIKKVDSLNEYWMNSPLPNVDN